MFQFDLSTLDERDIRDTIKALELILDCVAGQRNNPCFEQLRDLMKSEIEMRKEGMSRVVEVVLPISESTPQHLWCLTRFTCSFLETAAKGQPSAMALFFASVVNEIESTAQRLASAVNN